MGKKIAVINNMKFVYTCGPVTLNIGRNEIDEDQIKVAETHPAWRDKKKNEQIKYGTIEPGNETPEDFTDITTVKPAEDAITVVETTFDKAQLEEWKAKEKRVTVLRAIEDQLAYIEANPIGNANKGKITVNDNPDKKEEEQ